MKLRIECNLPDIKQSTQIAHRIVNYADTISLGPVLLFHYGQGAIEKFRKKLPDMSLSAHINLVDHEQEIISMAAKAGAQWVTVLAGTTNNIIHNACSVAHAHGTKVMLNLVDASAAGQSALEAQSLGVDALIVHKPVDPDEELLFADNWDMIKGNASIPIYLSIALPEDMETAEHILHTTIRYAPYGIIIRKGVFEFDEPRKRAEHYYKIISAL